MTASSGGNRPNILFLFCDQLRHDALSLFGHPIVKTPNLDRLARSGAVFRTAFTPTPVCVPARISLSNGLRNGVHRIPNLDPLPGPRPENPTIMTALSAAGYYAHAVGKTHFDGRHYGFRTIERMEECPDYILDDDYLLYLRQHGVTTRFQHGSRDLFYYQPQTLPTPLEHSPNEWVADRTIAFMRDHLTYRPGVPFFLWSSYIHPHPPFAASEPYASMYDPADIELPEDVDRPLDELGYGAIAHRGRLDNAHHDPDRMRRIMALYFGLITHVDAGIGRTLDALDALGIAGDTVVFFATDHGEMLGDHGLSQKNVPFEQAIRVPIMMRWPGRTEPGTTVDGFASLLDFFPTIIDGLGLDTPDSTAPLAGHSLLPALESGKTGQDEMVIDYGFGAERWVCLRTSRFKYTYWLAEGFEELYDVEADPTEQANLLKPMENDPDYREIATQMKRRLEEWEAAHGFAESLENGRFVALRVPQRPVSEQAARKVVINQGRWADNLPEADRVRVDAKVEAITKAIGNEPTVRRDSVSCDTYEKMGGVLAGTRLQRPSG